MAIADYLTQLISDRDDLADNLVSKGVPASHSETITSLVPKVLQIEGGGGSSVEIKDITLNSDGTYTVTDADNNTHTLAVTETDGQITAITYDGDNVPLDFSGDDLTGVGEADVDVSRYKGVGRIPAEYQEVEYIESTGTQYIDTGLYLADFKELYSEIAFTRVDGTAQYSGLYGASGGLRTWSIGLRGTNHITWVYPTTNSSYFVHETSITPIVNQKYKILTSVPFKAIRVKNYVGYPNYVGYTTGTDTPTFFIGARNNANNGEIEYYCYARYSDWIFYNYNNDNEMAAVAHFVPCYRKFDNEIGMYDIIRNQFFTNAGTDAFLKGGDV